MKPDKVKKLHVIFWKNKRMVTNAYNHKTQEVDAGRLGIQGQPQLYQTLSVDREMAEQVKALATKPDHLSLTPHFQVQHARRRELTLSRCPLTYTHIHFHTWKQNIKKYFFKASTLLELVQWLASVIPAL